MSIARHHAEWLPLVEVSGPFLSMPVLLEAFPQGLEAHDPKLPQHCQPEHPGFAGHRRLQSHESSDLSLHISLILMSSGRHDRLTQIITC